MAIRRIDLIESPKRDAYSVLAHFGNALGKALKKKGVEVRTVSEKECFSLCREDPPDLTLQFNACPRDEEGRLLCDSTRVPHAALLVDPPFRVFEFIKSPFMILTCDDAYWNHVLESKGFHNHFFLPHAASPEQLFDKENKLYDVAMLASCIDYEAAERLMQQFLSPRMRLIVNLTIGKALSEPETSFAEAFFEAVDKIYRKEDIPSVKIRRLLLALEIYLKGKDRTELVRAVKDAEIHVFGDPFNGAPWNHFTEDRKNIRLHEGVPFDQALEVMRGTKILLNSSIKNKHGAHERIFYGLLSGALVVTHENPYLAKFFQDEVSILFYRHNQLNLLNEKINAYLKDENKRRQVVEKGREAVLKFHTWDNRADTLLEKLPPLIERIKQDS